MKENKAIGLLIILVGVLVLFYKRDGVYGWGGYVDKSWENILISLVLVIIGVFLIKRNKEVN
ncbi:hypothetical protein [Tenacibaculum ovolyticum]|uniref:hypothetical protein n=1 Tax=Tenacibaculum ovolyticum TaxID=104270 RepID=UPI0007ECF57D|nr:hypothetical protein [Tenacibaculum ovolyticum]